MRDRDRWESEGFFEGAINHDSTIANEIAMEHDNEC